MSGAGWPRPPNSLFGFLNSVFDEPFFRDFPTPFDHQFGGFRSAGAGQATGAVREIPIEGADDDVPIAQHRLTGPVIHELPDHEEHLASHMYLNSSQPDDVEEPPEEESHHRAARPHEHEYAQHPHQDPYDYQQQQQQQQPMPEQQQQQQAHAVPSIGAPLDQTPPPSAAQRTGMPVMPAEPASQPPSMEQRKAPAGIKTHVSAAAGKGGGQFFSATGQPAEEPASPLLVHVEESMLNSTPRRPQLHPASAAAHPDWLTGDAFASAPKAEQWHPAGAVPPPNVSEGTPAGAAASSHAPGLFVRTPVGQTSAAGASPDAPAVAAAQRAPEWPAGGRGGDLDEPGGNGGSAPRTGIRAAPAGKDGASTSFIDLTASFSGVVVSQSSVSGTVKRQRKPSSRPQASQDADAIGSWPTAAATRQRRAASVRLPQAADATAAEVPVEAVQRPTRKRRHDSSIYGSYQQEQHEAADSDAGEESGEDPDWRPSKHSNRIATAAPPPTKRSKRSAKLQRI